MPFDPNREPESAQIDDPRDAGATAFDSPSAECVTFVAPAPLAPKAAPTSVPTVA